MRWMSSVVVAGLLIGGIANGASAAPEPGSDPVGAFYGATVEIDNLEGWFALRRLNPDGSFTQTGSDGEVRGTWAVRDGKLCTTQETPAPPPDRARTYCNLGPGHKLGDRWDDRDPVTGNPIYFTLKPRT